MEYRGCATVTTRNTNEKYEGGGEKKKRKIHARARGQTKRCIRLECAYAETIYTILLLFARETSASQPARTEFTHFISRDIREIKYTREIQDTLRSDKI